jgi:hypothetical protein
MILGQMRSDSFAEGGGVDMIAIAAPSSEPHTPRALKDLQVGDAMAAQNAKVDSLLKVVAQPLQMGKGPLCKELKVTRPEW